MNQSYIFSNYKKADQPGITWMSEIEYADYVYVDPYQGRVLGIVDRRYDWIFMSRMLHQCLLLRYDIGHLIVAIATFGMLALALTGMILWWPRQAQAWKQRLAIKWKASWRRLNYDVHSIGGLYTHLLIVLFAATGLVWSLDWWRDGIYYLLGDEPK
ncbi:MAG: PepSY domain-containing protein, partial [Bacteroidia bacterium]|nr:PepSY domain-containing protein [Bacteroidia bacterium]